MRLLLPACLPVCFFLHMIHCFIYLYLQQLPSLHLLTAAEPSQHTHTLFHRSDQTHYPGVVSAVVASSFISVVCSCRTVTLTCRLVNSNPQPLSGRPLFIPLTEWDDTLTPREGWFNLWSLSDLSDEKQSTVFTSLHAAIRCSTVLCRKRASPTLCVLCVLLPLGLTV